MLNSRPFLRRVFGQTPFPRTDPDVEAMNNDFRRKWAAVDGSLVDNGIELAVNWAESMANFWSTSSGGTVTPTEYAHLYKTALDTVADPWVRSMTK